MGAGGAGRLAAWLAFLFVAAAPSLSAAADDDKSARVEALRAAASEELAHGRWKQACALFDQLLVLAPQDAEAKRDAGRAGMAGGDFEYAARVLEQAHHGGGHHRDPELHYLRGEALYTLDRTEDARREHRIAELEILLGPRDRMETLWLARIHARRNEIAEADRLYEGMWPAADKPVDVEVALNHADAHLLVKDWAGAERILRRFLERAPNDLRGRQMLAFSLEAQGKLEEELSVRQRLAADDPSSGTQMDYGRALERAGQYRNAYGRYQTAADRAAPPGEMLLTARDRMRYRLTPEVAGGVGLRSDSTTTSAQLRAGAALPFASRQLVSIYATHEVARGGWPPADTAVTAVNAQLLLAAAYGGSLMLGGQGRGVTQLPTGMGGTPLQYAPGLRFGGVGEVRTPIGSPVRLEVRGELENQWTEAPISIRENGAVTGVTGHVYVYPIPRTQVLVIDTGAQARRLMLAPTAAGDARPEAEQLLAWGGADWVMWQSAASPLGGQILDENLVRPSEVAQSLTFALRHYELFGRMDPEFQQRVALVPRSSITMGTMLLRNAWFGGRFGFELRGGAGYDNARSNNLFQGGLSFYALAGSSGRVTASYDIAQETVTGLAGHRQGGWVSYHVDL